MLPDYLQDPRLDDIKLLAVDMDRTLLTDDRGFPEGLFERLDALYEAGVPRKRTAGAQAAGDVLRACT